MGLAGRARAEEFFDERAVVDRVLRCYQDTASGREVRAKGRQDRRSRPDRQPRTHRSKRALDITVSSAAVVALIPLLGLVWLLVRCVLGRPALFVQERPGLGEKPFRLHKFRTMRPVDPLGPPRPDDERLPRLGRWLRATSLDELPQLFDVLAGTMSLVGPRPLLVEYVDRYTPAQARRHEVKPGITGWAQINGRNAQTWEARLAMDVWYVDHQSLWLDLRILYTTVGRVLKREGISAPGQATMPEFLGSSPG
jgi:lipopolysaccharide/colanic/teichoic acid biosynthesis glycosyltransferase